MPAVYTHDKFGKLVYKLLSKENRQIIFTYLSQFRIGLQGPDFLFFYNPFHTNPIARLGHSIHERPAAQLLSPMMEVIGEKGKKSPEYAYILGLICHFTLDSECHHYINASISQVGLGHIELETEFERFMMQRDGLNPLGCKIWQLIPVDDNTANTLAALYPTIDAKTARSCLFQMYYTKKILTAPKNLHYHILDSLFHLSGHYDSIQGHLMKPEPAADCNEFCSVLLQKFLKAVPIGAELITQFEDCLENKKKLPERFQRDFIS